MGQEAGVGLGNEEAGWPSSCLSCHPAPWSPREDTSQKQLLGPPSPSSSLLSLFPRDKCHKAADS